jgi:uncharacterized protein (DUF2267 family)
MAINPRDDSFVQIVEREAGLPPEDARRAVRLSDGEVEDVNAEMSPALERGLTQSRKATRMALDQFLERIAKVDGVSRAEAERHARAVFAAQGDKPHAGSELCSACHGLTRKVTVVLRKGWYMIHLLIGILIVALVWVLTGLLGLPYIVSVIVTVLAALYILGGLGVFGGGRWSRAP